MRKGHQPKPPKCPYCGAEARLSDTSVIYGPGYDFGKAWVCSNYPRCDAYVGAHKHNDKPLGSLADSDLRKMRGRLHEQFDVLWQQAPRMYGYLNQQEFRNVRRAARRRSYQWLADQLGIAFGRCHIAMFDREQCERAIELCKQASPEIIRAWAKARSKKEESA